MNRVNVYDWPVYLNAIPRRVGHFDYDQATVWSDRDPFTGNGSGGPGKGEAVVLTADGRWVLERWSDYQGSASEFEYIAAEDAREWLLRNGEDDAVAEHFGPIEPERGPGRPPIDPAPGPTKSTPVRLGAELTAAADERAAAEGVSRAELIRRAVAAYVNPADDTATPTAGFIEFRELAATIPDIAAADQWYIGLILVGAPHEVGYPVWVGKFVRDVGGELDELEEWTVSLGRDRDTRAWHIDVSTNDRIGGQLSNAGAEALITTIRAAQATQRAMDAGYVFLEAE
jgi:hypothetical protein